MAIPAAPPAPAASATGTQVNSTGLSADQASAGFYIQPGDHIDILIDPGNGGIRYAFQDLPVLRVGASGGEAGSAATVYIVEVPRSQSELLAALVTLRGVVKTSPTDVTPGPFVVKYVLRPQSEWGKMAADGSSYTPNYEATTGPAVPAPADGEASVSSLDALFGH